MPLIRADFNNWDKRESFTLTEAAWLWCGLEPPDDGIKHMPMLGKGIQPHPVIKGLPAKGERAARAMWGDITEGKLVILTEWPDTRYMIPRSYLRSWAESYSKFRPLFLFEELRIIKPPTLKIAMIQVEYWDCGKGHRHKTLGAAERCISYRQSNNPEQIKDVILERSVKILKSVLEGKTMKSIGEDFGISQSRCAQIVRKTTRKIAMLFADHKELGIEAYRSYSATDIMKNRQIWLSIIDKIEAEFGLLDERSDQNIK